MDTVESIEHTVTRVFAALLLGEMPIHTFQQWVFTYTDVADVVGDDTYMRLLDIEYGLSSARQDVADTVQSVPALQSDRLLRSHVHTILCGLLNHTIPVKSACQQLAWWRTYGSPWIPLIFVGIDSELGGIPGPAIYQFWNDVTLVAKLHEYAAVISHYETMARTEAINLLRIEYNEPCEQ